MATLTYTLKEFRGQARRLLLTGAAVAVGVAFLVLAVGGSGALVSSFSQLAAAEVGPAAVQVTPDPRGPDRPAVPEDAAAKAARVAGVDAVAARRTGRATVLTPAGRPLDDPAVALSLTGDPALRWQLTDGGRWATAPDEVMLDSTTADRVGVRPGDRLHLLTATGERTSALLAGTLDTRAAPSTAGQPVLGAPDATIARYATGLRTTQLDLAVKPGAERAAADAVRTALGDDLRVRTGAASVDAATRDSSTLYGIVLVAALSFVLIAMAVARMVVTNTFSVVLSQQIRQLALLRCIGADRTEVRRHVRRQGLLLGIGASLVGLGAGAGAAAGGTLLLSTFDLGPVTVDLMPGWYVFALAFLFGVLLTLLAVRAPAKAASAVPPVAALGGAHAATPDSAGSRVVRTVFSVLLLGAGAALLAVGSVAPAPMSLLAVTLGAILSFFGVLRLARWLLPPVVTVLALPARRLFGTTGRLAAQQLHRNPGRTGSAASALLVGVTVMVAAATVVSTTGGSLNDLLSSRQPGAFSLVTDKKQVPQEALDAIGREKRLRVAPVRSATFEVNGRKTVVAAADPALLNDNAKDVGRARTLAEGQALAGSTGKEADVPPGLKPVPGTSSLPFSVLPVASYFVTPGTLERLAPRTVVSAAWVTTVGDLPHDEARKLLDRALADLPTVRVQDTDAEAEVMRSMMDRMVMVAGVLLAFSMLIAALGVAATLMLGVDERTREIGMLRAIGLGGGQLRAMLTLEAVLLSLTGAVAGTVLGLVYGWLAGRSVTRSYGIEHTPALMIAGLLGVTVLIGLTAAVLPARRVRRMAVVDALHAE
ncbi:ABC transporter permease [Streptomyces sp. NBC_00237]|uniref:FtsX-like permease family protein n=1 Tax=Streptomyces sp. NBC_00237 TaxID=2975687 RepID=UPI0022539366|nr:FtsX family ABC transporter permease [Streptomyces sp. NBC_00237]MCX5207153.1 ABC transporter permease [Streptomyces sp. NBC_00237]